MNKNIIWVGIVVIAVIGVGVWVLMSNAPASVSQPNPPPETVTSPPAENPVAENAATDTSTVPTSAIQGDNDTPPLKQFTVTGQNYSFSPSTMTVKKGDKVRITFKNVDGFHDLKIDEFTVATKKIGTGEQEVIEFVADKVGAFEYYCSVGNHRAMGMKGTLIVTE